jgi:UDPglucose 6-dehydrogenase
MSRVSFGKTVAFLGLSFKPNTDDVRESRALPIIQKLIEEGAIVKAYDPKAIENFKLLTDLPVEYSEDWRDAVMDADLVVIQSAWKEIQEIKADDYKKLIKNPIIIDGRRTYDPLSLICNNIKYVGIGWKNLASFEDLCLKGGIENG